MINRTLEEKQKILDSLMKKVNKTMGEGTLQRASDAIAQGKFDLKVFPTPSVELNHSLWCGGLSSIVELYGPQMGGKTSLAIDTIALNQRLDPNFIGGWLETEGGISEQYLQDHGIDMTRFYYFRQEDAGNGENAMDVLRSILTTGTIDMLVVNSVAGLAPQKEVEDDLDKQNIALTARLLSKFFRTANMNISKHKTCVIFINQTRDNVGQMFGNPETAPGGKALGYYSSQRIRMSQIKIESADPIKQDEGVKVSCIVKKNRFSSVHNPYTKCNYFALFDKGIDSLVSLPGMLSANPFSGVLQKGAHWYYRDSSGNDWHWPSKAAFLDEIRNNARLQEELKTRVSVTEQSEAEKMETMKEQDEINKEVEEIDRQVAGELFEE